MEQLGGERSRRSFIATAGATIASLSGCQSLTDDYSSPMPIVGSKKDIAVATGIAESMQVEVDISDLDEPDTKPAVAITSNQGVLVYSFEQSVWLTPRYGSADKPTNIVLDALGTSPGKGEVGFDPARRAPVWWDGDSDEYPSFVDNGDVLTDPVTVADTAAKTSVWSASLDKNSLAKGRTVQFHSAGKFSTANNSDIFTLTLELDGNVILSLDNVPATEDGEPWTAEGYILVAENGTSGSVTVNSKGIFADQPRSSNNANVAVDTEKVGTLELFVEWTAAAPGNSVTVNQAHHHQHA